MSTNHPQMIGIIAPSNSPRGSMTPIILQSLSLFKQQGFQIVLGNSFHGGQNSHSRTAQARAEDINSMFRDKRIKAILCALGGDSANQVLKYLDFASIQANPKPLIGYSDITHLLLAIHAKTKIPTYHGPNLNLLSQLSRKSLTQVINIINNFPHSDNLNLKVQTIKPGLATGKLVGGNLMVVNALYKTEYLPNLVGAILFWEEIDEGNSAVIYQLHQLYNSGILKEITGLVIGHIKNAHNFKNIKNTILDLTKDYSYPIVKTNRFGHDVTNFITFTEGSLAHIDTQKHLLVHQTKFNNNQP